MNLPLCAELFGRLLLATVLGGIVGWERERHGRAAGLRTMILVCLGSCLIMMTSIEVYTLFRELDMYSVVRLDPARIAYGVVTGIGFIGAGAILRQKDRIRGLTTAACLWVVTAVGLATGCGFYGLALATTLLAYVTLSILKKMEHWTTPDTYNHLVVVFAGQEVEVKRLRDLLDPLGIKVISYRLRRELEKGETTVELDIRHRLQDVAEQAVGAVGRLAGVRSVAWR